MDIDDLYRAAKNGNEAAESDLFKILAVRLSLFAYRRIGDRESARELVQDTLLKLVTHFREMEFEVSFSAWAYKVLKNDIMNYRQKGKRYQNLMSSISRQQETTFHVTDPVLESRVIACLKELIQDNRNFARVLNLKYQGYSSEEIKRRLKLTSSNLYVMLHRARLAMMACLKKKRTSNARV